MFTFKKKRCPMFEIKRIPFKICEHNPKAQSVCYPDQDLNLNDFYNNLTKQIKENYDSQRSNQTQVGVSVREKNNDYLRNRRR